MGELGILWEALIILDNVVFPTFVSLWVATYTFPIT